MIRVAIDLVPFGVETDAMRLHTLEIWNTGSKTPEGLTEYGVKIRPRPNGWRALCHCFTHDRDEGVLVLLSKAIAALVPRARRG